MKDNRNFIYPLKGKADTPFWNGLRERKFLLQKCRVCGEVFFPPRIICPECFSDDLKHIEAKGTGILYAFTEIFVPMLGFDSPYVLGLIELDENPGRFISRIDVSYETLRVGMKIKVTFVDAAKNLTLHQFVPVEQ